MFVTVDKSTVRYTSAYSSVEFTLDDRDLYRLGMQLIDRAMELEQARKDARRPRQVANRPERPS